MVTSTGRSWVVLVHRLPREPSTARIAVWRRLRALGVAQLADGVVALPEDARTREHLEWIAQRVGDAGGTALLLRAQTLDPLDHDRLVEQLSAARAQEYADLRTRAAEAGARSVPTNRVEAVRALRALRRELRAVQRRDYFVSDERELAVAEIRVLGEQVTTTRDPVDLAAGVIDR